MSEERKKAVTEHAEAETEKAEAEADLAETEAAAIETTAEAAVALAETQAAAAELDAAERVRTIEEGNAAWRETIGSSISALQTSVSGGLSAISNELSELRNLENDRHATLSARLDGVETRLPTRSTHQLSETGPRSEEGSEPQTEADPSLVGAGARANLGPAEIAGGASLGATESSQSPRRTGRPRRKWI